jgi:hemoglobin-like flavoprotein
MKALIQKDLRENLKVALIGLVIFSLLVVLAYQIGSAGLAGLLAERAARSNALQPLLSPNLLVEAAFLCPIFGAALGWLQSRNEAHRDLWAFLIHRPVTRAEIFLGKTIAGLCLYALAAGLPFAILVAVARIPGRVAAPFEWAMVLPLLAFFLTGVAWYFAGLLTGLRQARWYASRGFGFGLAIIASMGVSLAESWQWLILIAVAVVILATAVWGAYQSGGYYRGQPGAGRLALIVTLAAGCGVILFLGVALLFNMVVNPLMPPSFEYSYYQMTRDGAICKVTMNHNYETAAIVDLEGHPLLDPKTGQKMTLSEFQSLYADEGSVFSSFNHWNQNRNAFPDAGRFFSLRNITDKTLWYLDRHGKLLSYDGRTHKYAGILEPRASDGTLTSVSFLSQPGSFEYNYNPYNGSWQWLATAKAVYRVDFKAGTAKPIFTLPKDDDIGGYADVQGEYDDRPTKSIITTRQTVYLLDSEGRTIFAAPYQPGYAEYPQVQVFFLQPTNGSTAQYAVWFRPDVEMNRKANGKMPIHVLWLGPGPAVAKTADLPALPVTEFNSWPEKLAKALLPPPAHLMLDKDIASPWNVLSFTLALMSALLSWSLVRRYDSSSMAMAGWTLFVFLLGIAGLLTLLCVQEWPARAACPHCKKLRAVDRELCPHCQSPFAPPEKNGTEIFAPL